MDATYLDLTIRLSMALALGGAIGIEREYRAKEAGFRTHFLVALGSALFCIVSQYGFGFDLKDSSRVAAQVVSGIGFLGAGTIIFQKNVVRGLTTAAGLWVTAAIGLACGTGMYVAALATTLMVLLGLEVLNYLIPQFVTTNIELSFSAPSRDSVKELIKRIKLDGMEVHSYEIKDRRTSKGEYLEANIEVKAKRGNYTLKLFDYMNEFTDVTISTVEQRLKEHKISCCFKRTRIVNVDYTFKQETPATEPKGLIRVIWLIRVRKNSSCLWLKRTRIVL